MKGGIASRAAFSTVRYAQCWEDADVLLEALDVGPSNTCVSIASGGDNTLALLSRHPAKVVALDLNPAQLACLELRAAACRELEVDEFLQLLGARPCRNRLALYRRCAPLLSGDTRRFWDHRATNVERGIARAGKFEGYLELFRTRVLPFVHDRRAIRALFEPKSREEREAFYEERWNNARWRWLFRTFCSRFVIGHLARDPAFFDHVDGNVSDHLLERARYALTVLDPSRNPYLQWIFFGTYTTAMPYTLRPENYDGIRTAIDRLEWRRQALEGFLESSDATAVDRFNLSDIFEYMSAGEYEQTLRALARSAKRGARVAYWNMMVPRTRPESLRDALRPLKEVAERLHARDNTFFYRAFVLEEVL